MERLRVAVLLGGISAEREISIATGDVMARALARDHEVEIVEILEDGRWQRRGSGCDRSQGGDALGNALSAGEAVTELRRDGVDVIFNGLHGTGGEDGALQGLLRWAGLPFTGPDVASAAITMDKALTKEALRGAGIRTPRWFVLPHPERGSGAWDDLARFARSVAREVPLPWFAKPRRSGSSVGIAVLDSIDDFVDFARAWGRSATRATPAVRTEGSSASDGRVDIAGRSDGALLPDFGAELCDDLIIEERVDGRELTAAVLDLDGETIALPAIEIVPRHGNVFDWEAKYTPGGAEELCPAPLEPAIADALGQLALRIHRLFGCDPLSRTDFFLEKDGSLTVLEVNTLPGMTRTSLVPRAAAAAGISLEDLASALVAHAWRRAGRAVEPQAIRSS
ncbi:MAG TPA: hypothetical protein VK116_17440 [Planctomycetota bacterium]|nr:hypothetical protein [Planctomycetota bacterium]